MQQETDYKETERVYPLAITGAMCTPYGALYPNAYQQMVVGMIERHLKALDMDTPRLMEQDGVAWFLASMHLKIVQPIHPDMQLFASTWHTEDMPPVFRREFKLFDDQQAVKAVGTTFSSLIDIKTHRVCTNRALLSRFSITYGQRLLEAKRRYVPEGNFETVHARKVRPSWLDNLGHVNNTRYGELVYDAMTKQQQRQMDKLCALDIWFRSELRPDTDFIVQRAETQNSLVFQGVPESQTHPAFVMKLSFSQNPSK